jgi:hypothetical protein
MDDVFTPDGFTRVELAQFVKKIPTPYQLLDSLGLFPTRGVTTKTVAVEDLIETRGLLPSLAVGAPPTENSSDKRSLRSVATFHFALHDAIRPQDVQNVRAAGQDAALESLGAATMAKQEKMIGRLYETLEWLRMGALQGVILDGDGSTELLNLFTLFGATQRTTSFALNNSATDVLGLCLDEKDYLEANLQGAIMTGMPMALCSPTFFKSFVTHTLVKQAFQYYQANGQNLASDYRGGFVFGDIVWRSYAGSFTNTEGTSSALIAAKSAYLFPQGAGIGKTLVSPADFIDTVNSPGVLINFKQELMKYNKGYDLLLESNPLPICYRPELVVKLTTP